MTEYPNIVRPIQAKDEEALMELAIVNNRENGVAPLSETKMRNMIRKGINHDGCIIGVIDGAEGLAGSIGMLITQWWYSDSWHLEEIWNFVHPDYRKQKETNGVSCANKLLHFAKWSSEQMQMPLLIGVIATERMEAKVRLYQRQFPPVGALFYYEQNGAVQ